MNFVRKIIFKLIFEINQCIYEYKKKTTMKINKLKLLIYVQFLIKIYMVYFYNKKY